MPMGMLVQLASSQVNTSSNPRGRRSRSRSRSRTPAPAPELSHLPHSPVHSTGRQEQAGGKEEGALLVQVVSICGGRGRVAQRQRGADVRSSHKCCAWCGAVLCMVWAGGCSCVQLCRCVCVCVCVCWCVWAWLRPRPPGARAAAGRIAACAVPQAGCGMAVGCVGCVCVCLHVCAGVCWCLHGACVCAQVRSMHPATPAAAGRGARRGPACA